MKKSITLIALIIASLIPTKSTAQIIKLWKNGTTSYQAQVADVDSITFAEDKSANLQEEDLVGTWKIIHSKGQEKDIATGIVCDSWDEDVEVESNCWVFTKEGKVSFMEYSSMDYTSPSIPGMWHEDGAANFTIENGKFKLQDSSELTAQILSLCDDVMTIEYSFASDGNGKVQNQTDIAKRINKGTNVLRTEISPDAMQPEQLPYISEDDIVGTWLISFEKSLIDGKDDCIRRCENLESEQNYYVIFPDNKLGFLEYDEPGRWHLDGHEYIPYTLKNGKMSFANGRIIDIAKDSVRIYLEYVNDHNETELIIHTLRRVSNSTNYIDYEE